MVRNMASPRGCARRRVHRGATTPAAPYSPRRDAASRCRAEVSGFLSTWTETKPIRDRADPESAGLQLRRPAGSAARCSAGCWSPYAAGTVPVAGRDRLLLAAVSAAASCGASSRNRRASPRGVEAHVQAFGPAGSACLPDRRHGTRPRGAGRGCRRPSCESPG